MIFSVHYEKIQQGTLCTNEGMDEIRSEGECKEAAHRLGLQWAQSWNGPNDFPGCLSVKVGRNKVYFNTSPSPARVNLNPRSSAVCRASSIPLPDRSGTKERLEYLKCLKTKTFC